jgi:regulator of extracellular matrix RemA (YlzA/DUF370 family)
VGKLVNIGYGNVVNEDSIVTIVSVDSAPIRRLVQTKRDEGNVVDATQGRKTKGVIVTSCDLIILSALLPETIASRLAGKPEAEKNLIGRNENE